MVSYDIGRNWEQIECSERNKDFILHQPSLQTIERSQQIIASCAEPNEIGGRNIYLMLYKPAKDSVWKFVNKYCIYNNDEPRDMAKPTSILLDNNDDILTIYFSERNCRMYNYRID